MNLHDLGISAGSEWKGSVYIVFRNYRENLEYLTLWDMRIPTHNEYSQTSTPLWYYMTFKVMHTNDPKVLYSNHRRYRTGNGISD